MKVIILLACVYVTFPAKHEYPWFASRSWQNWTNKCLWFPTTSTWTMREFPHFIPPNSKPPKLCVRVVQSFKLRCERMDECLSTDEENQTCIDREFDQISDMPEGPIVGCHWGKFTDEIKDCISRPDIPDRRREAYKSLLEIMPKSNCIEKSTYCKCCCHPFHPNEDGTKCVKMDEEQTCPAFSEPNDWSECLWPLDSNIIDQFKDHCNLDYGRVVDVVPPPGLTIPDKCGMCSFRMRCRNRDRTDGCLYSHIQMEKNVCGAEDCPGCADICTIPFLNGTNCHWSIFMGNTVSDKVRMLKADPNMTKWHKREMENFLSDLLYPYGVCNDINGQCKCCCHPYEPNADGTKCVLRDTCATNL